MLNRVRTVEARLQAMSNQVKSTIKISPNNIRICVLASTYVRLS